jgi:hypothetical protein
VKLKAWNVHVWASTATNLIYISPVKYRSLLVGLKVLLRWPVSPLKFHPFWALTTGKGKTSRGPSLLRPQWKDDDATDSHRRPSSPPPSSSASSSAMASSADSAAAGQSALEICGGVPAARSSVLLRSLSYGVLLPVVCLC